MTTSAIRFRGRSMFAKDPELREFLKAVAQHMEAYARDHAATADWLVEACAGWMDDHEESPPGLRDLELDDVLTTPERIAGLADYLVWLVDPARAGDAADLQPARRVIESVLREVLRQ